MEVYDAIVLAGGGGRRLGGIDKASLAIGSGRLLDRALDAVRGAARVVVVGPPRDLPAQVTSVVERPPGSGPVAAIAAALPSVESGCVVVLACDMPFVTSETVERLVTAAQAADASGTDGAWLVDEQGRRQFLAAAYRLTPLRAALDQLGSPDGASMRQVVRRLTMTELTADAGVTLDCDTWDDVHISRYRLEGR